MAKRHYIGMAGLHGCMPSCCGSYDSVEDAAAELAALHDYAPNGRWERELRNSHYNDIPTSRGNEYAEIIPCDCDNPSGHND